MLPCKCELKLSDRSGRILARLRSISEVSACLLAGLHRSPVTWGSAVEPVESKSHNFFFFQLHFYYHVLTKCILGESKI